MQIVTVPRKFKMQTVISQNSIGKYNFDQTI